MVEPPVDFAIIAALRVEREAMVNRLAEVEKIQDEGEPLTYYVGKLAIPGEDRPYTGIFSARFFIPAGGRLPSWDAATTLGKAN